MSNIAAVTETKVTDFINNFGFFTSVLVKIEESVLKVVQYISAVTISYGYCVEFVKLVFGYVKVIGSFNSYVNIPIKYILHGPSMFAVKGKTFGVIYNHSSSVAFDEIPS